MPPTEMTAGRLRELLVGLPDDTPILKEVLPDWLLPCKAERVSVIATEQHGLAEYQTDGGEELDEDERRLTVVVII